ncbi:MAG: glucodextranase DOMON-like domain-containing protein [Halapricum sp.]
MRRRQYLSSVASVGAVSALGVQSVGAASSAQTEVGTISDPEGDDYGPGSYTYPTADPFSDGCFDVRQVEIEDTGDNWDFTVHLAAPFTDPEWDNDNGFSVQAFQMYLQDPNAPDDAPASAELRDGLVSTLQENYHYRVAVHGGGLAVVESPATGDDEEATTLVEDFAASGNPDEGTISFSLPKSPFETDDFTQMKAVIAMAGYDGLQSSGIRQDFGETASDYRFGGADPDAIVNAPRIIDLVGPDSVLKQQEALSYSADSPPTIPLTKVEYLISGELPDTGGIPEALASPGPEVWSTLEGELDGSGSTDPDDQELTYQWEQTGGPDVQQFNDTDTANPTFVAPDVDEESTLEFTLTVTDTDGNTATDTTTATVKPQSANDAPIADAGEDQTAEPGTVVSLQAVNSEDPNGGTLSFQWEQTSGPEVSLGGADSVGPAFQAPEVDEETTLTFELTVSDGQGKSTTDTVNVTVQPEAETTTTTDQETTEEETDETTTEEETDETTTEEDDDTGGGFGPGFGVVTGLLGAAGGAAYAGKRRLLDDSEEE